MINLYIILIQSTSFEVWTCDWKLNQKKEGRLPPHIYVMYRGSQIGNRAKICSQLVSRERKRLCLRRVILAAREGAGCISLETMFLRKLVDLIHTKARQRLRPGGDRRVHRFRRRADRIFPTLLFLFKKADHLISFFIFFGIISYLFSSIFSQSQRLLTWF